MKSFRFALLLLTPIALAHAQRGGGAGFFAVGTASADLGALNTSLNAAGYPSFDESGWTFGGGGYGMANRVVIGGEGHGMSVASISTAGGREVQLTGGFGMFDLGYAFYTTPRLAAYALGSIGGGGFQMIITDRDGVGIGPDVRDPTFDEVLATPGQRSVLTRGAPLVGLGIGLDYSLTGRGGFMVGARAGYRASPSVDRWRLYDVDLIGGPTAAITGPYVALTLGAGGRR